MFMNQVVDVTISPCRHFFGDPCNCKILIQINTLIASHPVLDDSAPHRDTGRDIALKDNLCSKYSRQRRIVERNSSFAGQPEVVNRDVFCLGLIP